MGDLGTKDQGDAQKVLNRVFKVEGQHRIQMTQYSNEGIWEFVEERILHAGGKTGATFVLPSKNAIHPY